MDRYAASTGSAPLADRAANLGALLEELEALPGSDIWRVRLFAGMLRIVGESRQEREANRGRPSHLVDLLDSAGSITVPLLDAASLAALGTSCWHWRRTPQWPEHWYLLGVRDFAGRRRLVPPGRFERFDEAMLVPGVDWPARYGHFAAASHCPGIESLRLAAVRVVQALDLEVSGVEEVRRRLAAELRLGQDYLSLECVEQLLEDATSLRSVAGGGHHGDLPA